MEGGIRVPAFVQWKGTIPPGSVIPTWTSLTDLMPTFLDAAGISKPKDVKWDGTSFLSVLKHGHRTAKQVRHRDEFNMSTLHSRVFLWHKDTDPYRSVDERINSAGYHDGVKVILKESGCIYRIFDMHHDPYENANLAVLAGPSQCSAASLQKYDDQTLEKAVNKQAGKMHCEHAMQREPGECLHKYHKRLLRKIALIMNELVPFVLYGKTARDNYNTGMTTCPVPLPWQPQRLTFSPKSCATSNSSCCEPKY